MYTKPPNAVWIKGYENEYAIFKNGNIWSNSKKKRFSEKIIRPRLHHTGYLYIYLRKNGVPKFYSIHRLKMMIFKFKPGCEKLTVNHKNGVKTDNRFTNLEWCTHKENVQHAHRTGLVRYKTEKQMESHRNAGKKNGAVNGAKTTSKKVLQFDKNEKPIREFDSVSSAARILGNGHSSQSNLSDFLNGRGKRKTALGYKWMFKQDFSGIYKCPSKKVIC